MRVAIDTNGLYTTQAGVARYIRGLLRGIRLLNPPDVQIQEIAWPVENFAFKQPRRALKTAYRELFWAKCIAPALLRNWRADLLHSTVNCLITPPKTLPQVVTIHDLAFLRFPERFRKWQRWSWTRALRRLPSVHRAICISRHTADELMLLTGFPASKIEVIHNGADFHPDESPEEHPPDFPIPPEFFLFVGSLEPGKNLNLLKESYLLAQKQNTPLPPLLIVGARWEGVAGEGPPPANWHYLGRQPDPVLVHLYKRALALLFPSKYEGFGLPVAEAMTLGCPVICSRVASLPEVGGEAALYAEQNPPAYLKAMTRLANDQELRRELSSKCPPQAAKFSWKKCAEQYLQVYRQFLPSN